MCEVPNSMNRVEDPGPERVSSDDPCIVCPSQVRGIYAVSFNLLNLFNGDDQDRLDRKLPERIQELQAAVNELQPFIDAHFADKRHFGGA